MADVTKAQKIAAARKKLKEYQQKSSKTTKNLGDIDDNLGVCENLSSSTHSSINDNFDSCNVPFQTTLDETSQRSPFHNYFNDTQNITSNLSPVNFFDNLAPKNSNGTISLTNSNNLEFPLESNISNYGNTNQSEDVPVINGVEQENFVKFTMLPENQRQTTSVENETIDSNLNVPQQNKFESQEITNDAYLKISSSSVESLKQLSSQMSDLMNDNYSSDTNLQAINRLENRNQELAALLDQERIKSGTLQLQMQEYQNKLQDFESDLERQRVEWENRLSQQLKPLEEQLQYYAQTNGILIGEKTELSMSLSQQELICKQKTTDCEELQGRLKTSRSRVADLEKELQLIKIDRENFQKSHTCKEENEKLKREYQDMYHEKEDISQELLEVREKLNIKVNENLSLQREIQDVTHQLSLAQVKIQQITAGESLQVEAQVEQLHQQNLALEKQIADLNQMLKITVNEKDQASVQYQNYVQHLNDQVTVLAEKLDNVTTENEFLSTREKTLVQHVGELEKVLQSTQEKQQDSVSDDAKSNEETVAELGIALVSVQNLKVEKEKLEENYQRVLGDKEDLLLELESKKILIEQLESQLDILRDVQPNSEKLLADMESDKVAASVAVTQNSQLKLQLEEMQQAFVKMTNDKMELTEKLTSEEFHNRDLQEKLNQYANQLHIFQEALNIKDNELQQMRTQSSEQKNQILQEDQLVEQLRHYEAQYHSIQALQNELKTAQNTIEMLTTENIHLKQRLQNRNSETTAVVQGGSNVPQSISSYTETVTEMDENKFTGSEIQSSVETDIIDKEFAMKCLEEKFTKMMLDIANLSEEKQRLEHIVTQLQGETETIGEYIALYQYQRGILKQRTLEKDEQLRRLSEDRQKVRNKLELLNTLVTKFMGESGVTPEMIKQHDHLNGTDLCSEHIRIRDEITKVAESVESTLKVSKDSNSTVEEIITLLAEIKSSNLIEPSADYEDFHPCSWCSGQLLTV